MKRILSLLLVITLTLCACTSPEVPESGETQNPVESVKNSDLPEDVEEPVESVETQEDEKPVKEIQEESKQEEEMPENVEPEEENKQNYYSSKSRDGTYEYKGLIFEGTYYTGTLSPEETFFVDTYSLDKEPGLSMYQAAFDIATLFYCNNTEKIKPYFENEEDYACIIKSSELRGNREPLILDNPTPINPHSIISYESEDSFIFSFVFDSEPDESNRYIDVTIFLNEDNEWKVSYIDFC